VSRRRERYLEQTGEFGKEWEYLRLLAECRSQDLHLESLQNKYEAVTAENEMLTTCNEEHQSLSALQDMRIEKLEAENERLREACHAALEATGG